MKLEKKKNLVARVLKIGKGRIIFDTERLAEIKEVITKQDIKDLFQRGIIKIKPVKGRKKIKKRKTKKGEGKIKKKIKKRKQEYVKITRKLRSYLRELRKQKRINRKKYLDLRKKIRARAFKNKAQLEGFLGGKNK